MVFRVNPLVLFLCFFCLVDYSKAVASSRYIQKRLTIINGSKQTIDIYWVDPKTKKEKSLFTAVNPEKLTTLLSAPGHVLMIREKPDKDGHCMNDGSLCRHVSLTVTAVEEEKENKIHITENFQVVFPDKMVKKEPGQIVAECRTVAEEWLQKDRPPGRNATTVWEELVECIEGGFVDTFQLNKKEIKFQHDVRKQIAVALENYTCTDDTLNSTDDVAVTDWIHSDGKTRLVHVKHERSASRIHVIENFIDEEECTAMETAASGNLARATVADGKGGRTISFKRRAMQAGIKVDWSKEAEGDLIARLSRRVYDYTNHVLGLDIKEHGQEPLMSIQYFGRGIDDQEPDRYTPHCDGKCTGNLHQHASRVATMVVYCDVADRGGHTNFRNAGVHVKPEKGNAIFFSYINPETMLMDTGFTEHSGCPVFEGTKRIVTQWVRYGVDEENAYHRFDSLGKKKTDDDNADPDGDEYYIK